MLVIQKGTFVPQVINILTAKDLSWNAEKASMRENVKKEYIEAQTSYGDVLEELGAEA